MEPLLLSSVFDGVGLAAALLGDLFGVAKLTACRLDVLFEGGVRASGASPVSETLVRRSRRLHKFAPVWYAA